MNLYGFVRNNGVGIFDILGLKEVATEIPWEDFGSYNSDNIEASYKTKDGDVERARWRWGFRARAETGENNECVFSVKVPIRRKSGSTPDASIIKLWQEGVKSTWSEKYRLCCGEESAPDGRVIHVGLEYGSDQKSHPIYFYDQNKTAKIINTDNWPINNEVKIEGYNITIGGGVMAAHEVGHFLGNPEEYQGAVTVLDVGRKSIGAENLMKHTPLGDFPSTGYTADSVMNGKGKAEARHYWKIKNAAESILKKKCTVIPAGQKCH